MRSHIKRTSLTAVMTVAALVALALPATAVPPGRHCVYVDDTAFCIEYA